MTKFRSPVRRGVRQRSGFRVADETTGGEVKIKLSKKLEVAENAISIHFRKTDVEIPELFNEGGGIVAFGGYIYAIKEIIVAIKMICSIYGRSYSENVEFSIDKESWRNIGLHIKVPLNPYVNDMATIDIYMEIREKNNESIGEIHFFGINSDSIKHNDYIENLEYDDGMDIGQRFNQKTRICIPYLYYFNHEEPLHIFPENIPEDKFSMGIPVVLKSCNRCGRFLLIEYEKEKQRHLISFGNHCVKKAPCRHTSFGRMKIIFDECNERNIEKPKNLSDIIDSAGKYIHIYYGYQLECKACKKFRVNAALNPKRNSTQHREDSLRRRAVEVLVDHLLGREWIYHKFRINWGKEFDVYIWEKFGKRCFNCGKELVTCQEMALDHTRPLSALWPLDETATCLCHRCNSEKSDKFPVEFYTQQQLKKLSTITGIKIEDLQSKKINENALEKLVENIEWFFDEFLMEKEYQKVRDGKKTADLIFKAIQKQIEKVGHLDVDLIEIYYLKTNRYPKSITLSE